MRGNVILAAAAALAACAPSNATTGGPPPVETVRVNGGGGSMTAQIHPTIATMAAMVPHPLERTWAALRVAYDSAAIPVTTLDQVNHVIGNPDLKARRRLGEIPLGRFLNCGTTLGSPNTDTYEIRLSVLTSARRDSSGGTIVMTTVDARGRPITISAEYTSCTSTGALEQRIVDLLKAQLR